MRVASLWQVPRAVGHVLTLRKADLLQIVWRRPSRRETIQPVAPDTSPSLLAVTGWIPSSGLWRVLAGQGGWLLLFLPGLDNLLLMLERWVYFLLFNWDLGRGLLFLQGDGFLRESRTHFFLFLKEGRIMQRSFKVVNSESPGLWWGRGCRVAYFMEVLEEVLWLHLSLV